MFNSYYKGESQQVFYDDHSNKLYWGDPVYRSKEYNRSDFYIYFVKTEFVKLKFIYSLHLMGGEVYHEQAFYATFDLDNLRNKKSEKRYKYLWDSWF
jgi:hypothetical protein